MRFFFPALVSVLAVADVARQENSLRTEILRILAGVEGVFAVAFEDLQTGRQLLINERAMFHAASTMKTPVMIEVFRQVRDGRLRLEDSIEVKNEFRSIVDGSLYSMDLTEDSDDSMYERIGEKVSVKELLLQMITVSSNLATNILVDLVGADNTTATMRRLGADSILVLRGVEDQKAFDLGLNNKTNAYDLLLIFRSLAEQRAVDGRDCESMLDILDDQKFRDVIPALLPGGTRVAHKTGSITGVEHDSGIVYLPDGRRYILILLSKGIKDSKGTKKALAEVSKTIYDFMISRENDVHRPR